MGKQVFVRNIVLETNDLFSNIIKNGVKITNSELMK